MFRCGRDPKVLIETKAAGVPRTLAQLKAVAQLQKFCSVVRFLKTTISLCEGNCTYNGIPALQLPGSVCHLGECIEQHFHTFLCSRFERGTVHVEHAPHKGDELSKEEGLLVYVPSYPGFLCF